MTNRAYRSHLNPRSFAIYFLLQDRADAITGIV